MNELEELKFEIRKISFESDELDLIRDLYIYNNLNYRMNVEFTFIKSQHEKAMLDIGKLTKSITDAREMYKEMVEENYSYSIRHNHHLKEYTSLKEKVSILMNEKRKLLAEHAELQASHVVEKSSCEDTSKNIYVPSDKQQQM